MDETQITDEEREIVKILIYLAEPGLTEDNAIEICRKMTAKDKENFTERYNFLVKWRKEIGWE